MKAKAAIPNGDLTHPVTPVPLENLHFDVRNPRYGPRSRRFKDDTDILDEIVGSFGVRDLLSSLAVNGYFASEPLVGIKEPKGDGVKVMEGNRRLAACLILANDRRARNQKKLYSYYSPIHKSHGSKPVEPVPVMVFEGRNAARELLPYLGIRHIVGSQTWDSYAKAAWVARVVEDGDLDLDEIILMIGDDQRTSERILSAYYLVEQLMDHDRFDPKDSIRKGKGSQAEFPFSLVYNALGFASIKRWINMPEGERAFARNPIRGSLDNAEALLHFICGSKRLEFDPSIKESRELSTLARAVAVPALANALKRGKPLSEVAQEALPARERVETGLVSARFTLEDVLGVVGRGSLGAADATEILPTSREVKTLSAEIADQVARAAVGNGEKK